MGELLLGVDVGTYSSKGLLCRPDGTVVAEARQAHTMDVPQPGFAEQDADGVWWHDVAAICRELTAQVSVGDRVAGVAVSAIGPCLLPVDADDRPMRPGILYGVDVRATHQIEALEARYGRDALYELGGMRLTSQAIGPKLLWLREHEPEVWARAARFHTATSYLVLRLTGRHVIDRHTASHSNPLIDLARLEWDDRYADGVAELERLPELAWADEQVGEVSAAAAAETGIPAGTPVACGTVDALAEAVSVGVVHPGDLMLMYGSTAFLVLVTDGMRAHPDLWATAGATRGQYALAAGMSTTGSATTWFRDQLGGGPADAEAFGRLFAEAEDSPPGSRGLLFLPYLSGERTPLHDPDARGVLAGLSLAHTRGDVFRSILEGTAFGLRHIIETMRESGAPIRRVVAVGGGAASRTWLSIVSSACGMTQQVPERTIGASYGDAFLAGRAAGIITDPDALERDWVRITDEVAPDPAMVTAADALAPWFRDLYRGSRDAVHALARWQRDEAIGAPTPTRRDP
ncbi:MAG: FGGY-family carbohydrate kinase [Chloroflexi bacterium]|nr:FGGY-family carbohydrate kinase [Chloroflexota bacterium]